MPNPSPRRVIVFFHPQVPESQTLATEIAEFLAHKRNVLVASGSLKDAELRKQVPDQDMIFVLGGDGSMLRGGRLTAPYNVPVLGINLGRLGFLPEVQPESWRTAVERVLVGDYWVEERMMLRVEHRRDDELVSFYDVLNEAVVSRGVLARPVWLKTLVDNIHLATYVADGLIISTPTGSTAYALAAGGPVLPPELKNILLIALAPHLSIDRAVVLAHGVTVDVIAHTEHQAFLSVDGQADVPLSDGDTVRVRISEYVARFVRVQDRNYFYSNLIGRLTQNPAANKH